MSKTPLVWLSLDEVNCLIAVHSLKFLADVDKGMEILVAGEYNDHKQFIVKKYSVIGKTKIMIEFEAMKKDLSFRQGLYVMIYKKSEGLK